MDNQERARARFEEPDNEDVEAHLLQERARTEDDGDDVEAHLLQADRGSTPRGSTPRGSTPRGSTPRGSTPRSEDEL
jgi:hypothetical protein